MPKSNDNTLKDKLSELADYYQNVFLPAYSDVVAIIADKPIQLLIEIENANSHIFQALLNQNNGDIVAENIKKAKNHLKRATLDSYKLSWVYLNDELNKLDNDIISLGLKIDEGEFLEKRKNFHDLTKKARAIELQNVGKDTDKCTDAYKEVINIGIQLRDSVDPKRKINVEKIKKKNTIIQNIISFIIGIATGIIGNFIFNLITNK